MINRVKIIILGILMIILITDVTGQRLGMTVGFNRNNYYDFKKDDGHFKTKYNPNYGYTIGISLDYIKIGILPFRFTLKLDNYKGKIFTTDGGLGGSATTEAKVSKNILGLGIYPFNARIYGRFLLSIGGEFNLLLNQSISGYQSSWNITGFSSNITLNDNSNKILSKYNFGILGSFGYQINLPKNWHLIPRYNLFWGLTKEFINIEANTKSFRQYIKIELEKRFK